MQMSLKDNTFVWIMIHHIKISEELGRYSNTHVHMFDMNDRTTRMAKEVTPAVYQENFLLLSSFYANPFCIVNS